METRAGFLFCRPLLSVLAFAQLKVAGQSCVPEFPYQEGWLATADTRSLSPIKRVYGYSGIRSLVTQRRTTARTQRW